MVLQSHDDLNKLYTKSTDEMLALIKYSKD